MFNKEDIIVLDVLLKNTIRYVVADKYTGEILDDAQGQGYASKEDALASTTTE